MLSVDQSFTVSTSCDSESGRYIILKSGTLLLVYENREEEFALTAQAIDWKDDEKLIRLKDAIVTFETNGGSEVESQTGRRGARV